MEYTYNAPLVLFSAIIAVATSYFVIEMNAETLLIFRERFERIMFWAINSILMAMGIWGMHFVAMTAFSLEIEITYDLNTVLVSFLAAFVGCFFCLLIISRPYVNRINVVAGAIIMGSAIAGMHYIGMSAMKIENVGISYNPLLLVFSVMLAIFVSLVAILLILKLREPATSQRLPRSRLTGLRRTSGARGWGDFNRPQSTVVSKTSNQKSPPYPPLARLPRPRNAHQDTTKPALTVGQVYFWKKVFSSLLMGGAILAMHYTGMAAARFTVEPTKTLTSHTVITSNTLGFCAVLAVLGCLIMIRIILFNAKFERYN
ncbi:MHYT domain-containing protein [Hyella patelloides]|nr:MHYT domain-containing protein [Hyella patelloides]